ncbi:hypothetical protein VUR80DRAFT_3366 [Thermomyces stellatus]
MVHLTGEVADGAKAAAKVVTASDCSNVGARIMVIIHLTGKCNPHTSSQGYPITNRDPPWPHTGLTAEKAAAIVPQDEATHIVADISTLGNIPAAGLRAGQVAVSTGHLTGRAAAGTALADRVSRGMSTPKARRGTEVGRATATTPPDGATAMDKRHTFTPDSSATSHLTANTAPATIPAASIETAGSPPGATTLPTSTPPAPTPLATITILEATDPAAPTTGATPNTTTRGSASATSTAAATDTSTSGTATPTAGPGPPGIASPILRARATTPLHLLPGVSPLPFPTCNDETLTRQPQVLPSRQREPHLAA